MVPASVRTQGCPCTSINNYDILVPEFVQNDYFCESGTAVSNPVNNRLYDEDPSGMERVVDLPAAIVASSTTLHGSAST